MRRDGRAGHWAICPKEGMTMMYTFAVGHTATESFGGYEGGGWGYITAPSADIAWLKAKREWDLPCFRLADFRAAAHRADLMKERRFLEIEEPRSYNCKFLQCKREGSRAQSAVPSASSSACKT